MILPSATETGSGGGPDMSPEARRERPPRVDFSKVRVSADGHKVPADGKVPAGAVVEISGLPATARADIVGELQTGIVTTLGGLTPVRGKPGHWKTAKLPPRSTWEISLSAPGGQGRAVTIMVEKPEAREQPYISPSGGTYGVGMPVTVSFSEPVTRKGRVQQRVSLNSSRGIPEGAWSWMSDSELVFRPRDYWPAHTAVEVRADLDGIEVSPGVWGKSARAQFNIGREMILIMHTDAHAMNVRKEGRVVRTIPVSGGMPGWETADGIKVISEKFAVKRLYNPGPNGWDVTVPWAMRLTYTGEFIHSAPWNSQIGSANTSHGCTNMTTDDAKWVYDHTIVGDVVESSGSGLPIEPWNGLGGLWNISWEQWLENAAGPTPRDRARAEMEGSLSPMTFPG